MFPSPRRIARSLPSVAAASLALALAGAAPALADDSGEARFLAENDAAMTTMMNGMAVKPSGDVDQDFVAMMTAHHQGAIDMALALLRHGRNEQLRRIAQEIIVEQQQEIAAMKLAIGAPLPPSAPVPTQTGPTQTGPDVPPPSADAMAAHHHSHSAQQEP
ncbi:DUF305 domain-containing protein [Azospirillum rugosum]|uniref:DUF305 domain-containing protein n=1 Tax=Azospirillum rugosum TaxID=416170 RepID=A0ABS4SNS5_9PROT|nr:DUF305 domain-containing protein [Azospirillum rugosum]MBP2293738.1 hypothetical protein [Azospirillum rugosum]MDQ0527283.1 hypothetical protein [Azospirillum rugosum]